MPQLGETVTEGTIIRWMKAVGDAVAQDEPLFEVSTDKVDSEVPSPVAGVLQEILVQEGETVDVGARLAVVGEAGSAALPSAAPATPATEAPAAPAGPAAEPPPVPAAATPAPAPAPEIPAPAAASVAEAPAPASAPAAAAPAPAAASAAASAPVASATAGTPDGSGTDRSRGALLSPVVRRLITEHELDPSAIPGTGMGGRITREDVLGFIDTRVAQGSAAAPAAQVATAPVPAPTRTAVTPAPSTAAPVAFPATAPAAQAAPANLSPPPPPLGLRDEVLPFTTIRRVTAEHMVRSKATSAHTLMAIEVDFEAVERVRRANRERFKAEEGVSLTYLPFIARATIDVLRSYPHLNSSVGDDALVLHKDVHLGVAVDLDGEGLMVPVIHNVDGQSLRGIARSVADLASRARSRKLSLDDISGGTFTITNPGPFGTFVSFPIIAQPQVAILSTDGVKRKPVVVTDADGSESIAIHSVGILALSFDHRAVDGAYVGAFLRDLANVIETRDWPAEL